MDSIKKLTDLFSKFPTIGPRTAGRFVYYLINLPKEKIDELSNAILEVKNKVKMCSFCFQPFEALAKEGLCQICSSTARNKQLLCVVEKEADLLSLENTKKYGGLYFILGGVLTLRKNGDSLRLAELKDRVSSGSFSEIIIALNPTPEGKATSVLVERTLKELSRSLGDRGSSMAKPSGPQIFKITHLAQGLPVGGELEYADEETLESAFEGRK